MKKIFFTGHRTTAFVFEDLYRFVKLMDKLAMEGTEDFYAGGAQGWDMTFAGTVLLLKKHYPLVKLHLVLPCPPEEQTDRWNIHEKKMYQEILKAADSVEIVSEHYDKNCMKKRNERLVELGDVCVCYYNEKRIRSGTGQTVRLAQKQGKEIINLYAERTEGK